MGYSSVVILALVEGLTEFLPVSSTGHLIIASRLLQLHQTDFLTSFEIAIQSGAMLAVVAYYRQQLFSPLLAKILVGFAPTAMLGWLLYPLVKTHLLGNYWLTLWATLGGGLVLLLVNQRRISHQTITYLQAFVVGTVQSLALVPGVSRSGAAIVAALLLGLSRPAAVEFSLLLAVPTICAATVFNLAKSDLSILPNQPHLLLAGFGVTAIVAFISLKFLVAYVQNHSLRIFGIYRLILFTLLVYGFQP